MRLPTLLIAVSLFRTDCESEAPYLANCCEFVQNRLWEWGFLPCRLPWVCSEQTGRVRLPTLLIAMSLFRTDWESEASYLGNCCEFVQNRLWEWGSLPCWLPWVCLEQTGRVRFPTLLIAESLFRTDCESEAPYLADCHEFVQNRLREWGSLPCWLQNRLSEWGFLPCWLPWAFSKQTESEAPYLANCRTDW